MTGQSEQGGGASRSTDSAAGTSSATDVSLREFFSALRSADRDFFNAHRQTVNERFGFLVVVGGVIWFFVERHLTDLNHENARVAAVSERSVSQDTYIANEAQRKAEQQRLDERLAQYDTRFTETATRDDLSRETKVEKRAVIGIGWQTVAGIVGLILVSLAIYAAIHSQPEVVPGPTVTVTVPSK